MSMKNKHPRRRVGRPATGVGRPPVGEPSEVWIAIEAELRPHSRPGSLDREELGEHGCGRDALSVLPCVDGGDGDAGGACQGLERESEGRAE